MLIPTSADSTTLLETDKAVCRFFINWREPKNKEGYILFYAAGCRKNL